MENSKNIQVYDTFAEKEAKKQRQAQNKAKVLQASLEGQISAQKKMAGLSIEKIQNNDKDKTLEDTLNYNSAIDEGSNVNAKKEEEQAFKEQLKQKYLANGKSEVDLWVDPSYKLTGEEKARAKEYVKNAINQIPKEWLTGKMTPENQAKYNKLKELQIKTSSLNSSAMGMLNSLPFNIYGKLQKARKTEIEKIGGIPEDFESISQNAQKQNPLAYGGGYLGGKIGQYSIGGQVMSGVPLIGQIGAKAGAGISSLTGGKIAANTATKIATNLIGDTTLDFALDTIPEVATNIQAGKSAKEIAQEAAKNIGINVGFNLGAEGVGQVAKKLLNSPTNIGTLNQNIANSVPITQSTPKSKMLDPIPFSKNTAANDILKASKSTANTIGTTSENNFIPAVKKVGEDLYSNFISKTNALEKVSKFQDPSKANLEDLAQAVRNADSSVSYIVNKGLVDRMGNKIDADYKQIAKLLDDEENLYMLLKHNSDRMSLEKKAAQNVINFLKENPYFKNMNMEQVEGLSKSGGDNAVSAKEYLSIMDSSSKIKNKPVFDMTSTQSTKAANQMAKKNPSLKKKADRVTEWYDKFMNEYAVKGGLISQSDYNYMKKVYPNYVPTYRVENNVGGFGSSSFGNNIGTAKTIKSAKGGTSEVKPLADNFMGNIQRTVKAVKKNDLIVNLYNFAKDNPEKAAAFAAISEADESVKGAFKKGFDDFLDITDEQASKMMKDGQYRLTGFIGGKPIALNVNKDIFDGVNYLFNKNEAIGETGTALINMGRAITAPMKTLTTNANPFFAIKNIVRDTQTGYLNTISDKKTLIGYVGDLVGSAKQMTQNSSDWNLFLANGGENVTRYHVDKGFENSFSESKGIRKIAEKAVNALTWTGEQSENISRFNEFRNGLKKYGKTPDGVKKAMQASADATVNFSRSAPITKVLDAWTPYLNANIQGLDKTARQLKAHPIQTLRRGAEMLTAPTILLYLLNKENPHYQELNDNTKDNYFLIPNVTSLDENGNAKTFIKMPKSREYGAILSATFERSARILDGEDPETAFSGLGETFKNNYGLNNIFMDNLPAQSFIGAKFNKNYFGGDIVPANMQNLSPKNQYDYKTSSLATNIGQKFNLSPKKIDYMLDQWGGFAADVALPMMSQNSQGPIKTFMSPVTRSFTADPLYQSQSVSNFYDELQKATTAAADLNFEKGIDKKYVTYQEKYLSTLKEDSSAISMLSKQENHIQQSLISPGKKQEQINEIRQMKINIAKNAKNKAETVSEEMQDILDNIKEEFVLTGEETNKASEYAGDYATQTYKQKTIQKTPAKWILNAQEYANKNNVNEKNLVSELAAIKAKTIGIEGQKDTNGKTISETAKMAKIKAIQDMGYSYSDAITLYKMIN